MAAVVTSADYGCKSAGATGQFLYKCDHYSVTHEIFPYAGYVIILAVLLLTTFGTIVYNIYAEKDRINRKLAIEDKLNPASVPEWDAKGIARLREAGIENSVSI